MSPSSTHFSGERISRELEELHNQALSDVDKLEVELRRASDGKQSGQVNGADSQPVPAGYEDAVADYFGRLSKTP